jgi:hypothetical protein
MLELRVLRRNLGVSEVHISYFFRVEEYTKLKQQEQSDSIGIFLDLLFDPQNEGDIFLRNVELYQNYTASQPRRPKIKSQLNLNPSGTLQVTGG